jgi:hypothetical protein
MTSDQFRFIGQILPWHHADLNRKVSEFLTDTDFVICICLSVDTEELFITQPAAKWTQACIHPYKYGLSVPQDSSSAERSNFSYLIP